MDEADALGSRISIMVAGQLACLGTAQALKSRFGAGYDLEASPLPPNQELLLSSTVFHYPVHLTLELK